MTSTGRLDGIGPDVLSKLAAEQPRLMATKSAINSARAASGATGLRRATAPNGATMSSGGSWHRVAGTSSALEAPDMFVQELRAFFAPLR